MKQIILYTITNKNTGKKSFSCMPNYVHDQYKKGFIINARIKKIIG